MNCKEFTKKYYTNRKNTNCVKWDSDNVKGKLPMFIADMDFKCEERIIKKLCSVVNKGTYGYSFLPADYKKEFIKWNIVRHNIEYKEEWIRFSKGAIDAIFQIIHSLTNENDSIIITTPVYPNFFSAINSTKRKLVCSPLINKGNHFEIDFNDFENKIVKNNVKLFILCSPHNPLSRVWSKDELNKMLSIAHKHNVIVISDEVHNDLIMPGYNFIPSQCIKKYQKDVITVSAFSKTFSLAAFSFCHMIIPNKEYRAKIDAHQIANHQETPNAYNGLASYYGMKYSSKWLDQCIDTIYDNYLYFKKTLSPYLNILDLEGTYLTFVDFSKYTKNAYKFLYDKCDIVANDGEKFDPNYASWVRINLATSKKNIEIACDRIKKAIQ